MRALVCALLLACPWTARADDHPTGSALAGPALAELAEPEPAEPEADDVAPTDPPPYRPYSIPWLLRPLPAVDVVRLDQSFALHDAYGPANDGLRVSFTQVASFGVRAEDWLSIVMRQGWSIESDGTFAGSTFLIGCNFAALLTPTIRLSVFVGATVPEGGNNRDASNRDARLTRLAMENALFLPNHFTGLAGVGLGWIDGGWTVQIEGTVFALAGLNPDVDPVIGNATFGLQVGYFLVPELSISGELHHQHLLSSPAILRRAPPLDYGEEHQSQTSATLGIRAHIRLEGRAWFRPGIAWGAGFDAPMSADSWNVIQLDLPFVF